MGNVDKERMQIIRDFFRNHPDAAKEFVKKNPGVIEWLSGNDLNQKTGNPVSQASSQNFEKGKRLTKANGLPMMFNWDKNDGGFSNYVMLAILAFSIQFIITLICIFFYK